MENAYSKAGVNVEAGYEVVERIQKHSQKTQRTERWACLVVLVVVLI